MRYEYPLAKPVLGMPEKQNLVQCISDGWVSGGSFVSEFEDCMADLLGRRFACSTSSGTAALHLALEALGIGKGDLVIVPTLTYVASVNAILQCGATPLFVDSRESDWQMDEEKVVEAFKKHHYDPYPIRAILAVHLYGAPCNISFLEKFCHENETFLIEDAAEALGSGVDGKPVGSFGDVSIFSFYGNKNITTGEGGMALTDDEALHDMMSHLKNHATCRMGGEVKNYYHDTLGYNYRMSNLNAAVGCAQVDRLDDTLKRKAEICELYTKTIFRPVAQGRLREVVKTWKLRGRGVKAGRWLYSLVLETQELRDGLISHLENQLVETRPFFEPCDTFDHLEGCSLNMSFPVACDLSRRGINLPTYVQMTDDDVKFISNEVILFLLQNVTQKG